MHRRAALVAAIAVCLLFGALTSSALAATRSASSYRGSVLMWTRAATTWTYNGSTISYGSTTQSCGYIFPNLTRNKGIQLYKFSSSHWRYQTYFGWGAGTVTPWGSVTLYWQAATHTHHVYGNGAYSTASVLY